VDASQLLKHYASFYGPEAGPWNLSPECMFVDYKIRSFVSTLLERFPSDSPRIKVCNVGIGQGDWDIFLSCKINSKGELTSVDISAEICETLSARLLMEENPNVVHILNEDINRTSLSPNAFDLVTIVGSTVAESGQADRTVDSCLELVRPCGILMYSDFNKNRSLNDFRRYASAKPVQLLDCEDLSGHSLPFFIVSLLKA
jgi:SAM-dependent methyltransferase